MCACVCVRVFVFVCVCVLTDDALRVVVRFTHEVRYPHQQRGQASEQSSSADVPWPMDSTPKEAHKDYEDGVSHLYSDTQHP